MIMVELYHWNLRFSLGIYVYLTRTKSCFAGVVCHLQSFFRHRAAQYWNSLLTNIKDHVQFGDFKSSVKTYPRTYVLSML